MHRTGFQLCLAMTISFQQGFWIDCSPTGISPKAIVLCLIWLVISLLTSIAFSEQPFSINASASALHIQQASSVLSSVSFGRKIFLSILGSYVPSPLCHPLTVDVSGTIDADTHLLSLGSGSLPGDLLWACWHLLLQGEVYICLIEAELFWS